MDVLFERVAGLDVGKASVTVCVRTPGPGGKRVMMPVTLEAYPGGLIEDLAAAWDVATASGFSKVYCTQAAFEVASEAIQLHGGYGLTKEMLVEKLFRDARASMIEDGSNDILSLTAAKKVLEQYVP